ncbi:MAG TPA: uroporphyrinogen-III C-methyltransferase [Chitinophagaceae bacterium]|jgi:uroporphyrin-III C-methyltransferase|nr:uroporphyrinogen-III C-methyltransferase [Chitinophagaceae bacterium]
MNPDKQIQKVIFSGAGPGDPELITLKAIRYLKEAEVIITDRLVSDAILETYADPGALVLHAGKQRRRDGSTPQHIINELLVEYALQGKKVVRLKGGDVSVFSNLLDELKALNNQGIPYEIIPGITAACGAAATAGIPLTARNHAQAVRFLTLHQNEIIRPAYWKELAHTEDTLVFYMSGDTTGVLVKQLLDQGMRPDTIIAVIEQATTPLQKVSCCPLQAYEKQFGNRHYVSPTLIIVGKVAGLHQEFRWMPETELAGELYFKPVTKNTEQEVRA